MKNLKLVFLLVLFTGLLSAQTKDREKPHPYVGAGYSLIIFTNSAVSDIYPVVNLNTSSFLSEINVSAGYKLNKNIALEFNPAFVFASSTNNKGFNFYDGVNNYFYLPNKSTLFILPLNAKMKIFPFAKQTFSFVNNIFVGIGGGPIYISEQYDNAVYESQNYSIGNVIKFGTYSNSFWRYNAAISAGYDYAGAIGLGFEFTYRIVPLAIHGTQPVISSIASNFNSINLSVKASFGFW
jgi:hypothetical protein